MQHLLSLGIGVLRGNLMDLADHSVAILSMQEDKAYQKVNQEQGKAQQTHQRAHTGPLPAADSNWAVAPVTGNGPNQVGGQKHKQGQRVQRHCENVSERGQRYGSSKEVFPIDSYRSRKLRWQS